jgi:hypothetical protein
MSIVSFLPMRRVAPASLIAGVLAAAGCADGGGGLTGPTAIAAATSQSASAHNHDGANLAPSASPQLPLLLTKTCDAIDHCTVITSQAGPIPVDSQAFYSGPLLESRTTSGVVIRTPSGDTATGHCSVSYKTGLGTCVFTRGTGALAGFHANLKVSSDFVSDPAGVFTWDGQYHFVVSD